MIEVSDTFLYFWIALAVLLIPVQFLCAAPYGRHSSDRWGPTMNNKRGWVLMELVALTAFVVGLTTGVLNTAGSVIAALFIAHYVHRSLIYPLMTHTSKKHIPLMIVGSAIVFNSINGYVNGEYLVCHPEIYNTAYLQKPNFIVGAIIFLVGAVINISSDYYLISLRGDGSTGYKIPRDGFFKYVSCPNHMAEIVEWAGFAIMCGSLPALAFAVWTASNLIPRAWHHHQWYREKFNNQYPESRKAVIPGIL